MIRPGTRQTSLLLVVTAAFLLAAGAASSAPTVESKEEEAQRVLTQIQQIDAELGVVVEAYNAAQIRLDDIKGAQATNEKRLEIARGNLRNAQARLAERLVAMYTSDDQTALEVLLGATTLDELLDRIETVTRVSEQDARIIAEVRSFRAEIKRREAELAQARADQERVVAERAAKRAEIERQIAERQRLLASIKSEIAEIRAREAAAQRRAEAQARARLSSSAPSPGGGNPPPGQYGGVVGIAMQYLGIPYLWGGAAPGTGFDCSGFIMYVYAQVGVSLPHNAAMQYGYGSPVSRENLQPGDLVFFNGLGHNGIYIGGNQFIHSPHTGDVVKISTLTGWYDSTWVGARRL